MPSSSLFFFYFASVAIFSSVLTIGLRNPVHCTLALLSAFLHIAGLFVLLHAEFVAAVQVIVYAGAVLVLYLFVLMLLNLKQIETFVLKRSWITILFACVLTVEILLMIFPLSARVGPPVAPSAGNTETIGMALFTEYIFSFEVVGILLLGAAVGALVLAKQTPSNQNR